MRGSPPGDRGRFHPHWHVGGTGVASGWRGRQNYFSKTHLRSLFRLPPPKKICLSLNYIQSFYKFHFTCCDQTFKALKHTDSGEVQSQCCQLSGPTSHVLRHMTLCHEVSGSRRFGVSSPSRANSLLGHPDGEERTPQLHLCENPTTVQSSST